MLKEYFNPLKVLMHSEKINKILEGGMPLPVAVEIDPSNACNVNCPWCLFDKTRKKNNDRLSPEFFNLLMFELKILGIKSVTFTGGGEPLVNSETFWMIQKYGKDFDLGLVTNGISLKSYMIKDLVKNLKYIRISVDAATEKTYEKMKGIQGKHLNHVKSMIKLLTKERDRTKKDFQVGIAFVIHKDNWHETLMFTKQMKRLGVDYIAIRPIIGWNMNRDFPKKHYKKLINLINKSVQMQSDDFRVFANIRRMEEVKNNKKNFTTCKSTPLIAIIGADRNIYICCQMRLQKKWSIGKIDYFNNTFLSLWKSKKHKDIINSIDVRKCVPCRNGRYNEIIEDYFMKDYMHKNFI